MNLPPWLLNSLTASAEVSERQVFFVMGCQKSGTTWVQRLLDGHPHVCCGGEGHFGDVAGPILERAVKTYNDLPKTNASFGGQDLLSLVRLFADRILAGYLAGSENPKAVTALGDKTPETALTVPIMDALYPGARYIHIIRDGRDGAVSGWAHLQRLGTADRFKTFADYAAYFAEHHWVPYITAARRAGTALKDRYLELRYEQLHAEPKVHARRLLEFLGVDAADEHVAACVEAAAFSRVSKGRRRGEEDRSSHFRKGIVGDWANHFDRDALGRFEAATRGMLRELDYTDAQAVTSIS